MKISLFAIVMMILSACSSSSDHSGGGGTGGTGGTDGGAGGSTSACKSMGCYVASDNLCDEYTQPTADYCTNVPGSCASRAGTLSSPAACPTANFTGKCIMPGPGGRILRYYGNRGDAADQSFCTDTATGTWSTTF
jgi:hypothetical protein